MSGCRSSLRPTPGEHTTEDLNEGALTLAEAVGAGKLD